MSPEIISLLVQIPLVGAFIVFTIYLLKSFNESQITLQLQQQSHEKALQAETLAHLQQQELRWQELLGIERERRKDAMDQGLREMEVLVKSIAQLTQAISSQQEAITSHEAGAETRHGEIIRHISPE